MAKYYIIDPNIFEEVLGMEDNYNENDIYDMLIPDLIQKYGDDIMEAITFKTNNLDYLWEEVGELLVDYYEDRTIVPDLFEFIPMSTDTAERILSSYNYVLKIQK